MATFITPVEVTPAPNGAWTDVDCSAHIPAGSTGVILHISSPWYASVGWRKNGSTDARTDSAGLSNPGHWWAMIGVDANRVFEFYKNDSNCKCYLVGYTGSEAVFFDNAVDKSLGIAAASWRDVDISANTGADTAVAAVFEIICDGTAWGLRKNGSTYNQSKGAASHVGAIAGVDGSEILEAYYSAFSVSAKLWLVGYFKSGVTMPTEPTDLSLGGTGAWTDLTAITAGAVGGMIDVLSSTYDKAYGLRENGSTEDIYQQLPRHAYGFVEADASQIIEGEIADTNIDFWLTGTFDAPPPPDPVITLLNPNHGAVGDSVTITGTTFEAAQGAGTVTFNGVPATVTAWADTSITVTVPVGATTGNVVVTNNTGDASAGVLWTLDAPAPAAAGGTTPALGRQLHSLGASAVLGHPPLQT